MATIICSAEKVTEAALAVIDKINAVRKEKDEKRISQQMKNRKYILFGRTLTREEAIKELEEDAWSFFPSIYAWGDLDQAQKLLLIAKHGDPVTLNENDARVLF